MPKVYFRNINSDRRTNNGAKRCCCEALGEEISFIFLLHSIFWCKTSLKHRRKSQIKCFRKANENIFVGREEEKGGNLRQLSVSAKTSLLTNSIKCPALRQWHGPQTVEISIQLSLPARNMVWKVIFWAYSGPERISNQLNFSACEWTFCVRHQEEDEIFAIFVDFYSSTWSAEWKKFQGQMKMLFSSALKFAPYSRVELVEAQHE